MVGDPVCVAPTGDVCGEGAVWHAAHDAVYWTDINRFLIHRFTPADRIVRTWIFDEPVTALTLTDRAGGAGGHSGLESDLVGTGDGYAAASRYFALRGGPQCG